MTWVSLMAKRKEQLKEEIDTTAEEILQKNFEAEFGHEGHGEFMPYILKSMEQYAKLKS